MPRTSVLHHTGSTSENSKGINHLPLLDLAAPQDVAGFLGGVTMGAGWGSSLGSIKSGRKPSSSLDSSRTNLRLWHNLNPLNTGIFSRKRIPWRGTWLTGWRKWLLSFVSKESPKSARKSVCIKSIPFFHFAVMKTYKSVVDRVSESRKIEGRINFNLHRYKLELDIVSIYFLLYAWK